MKTNSVPAVIMLTAGLIDCIVSIYQRLSLFDFTKQLLIVLVIFYLLGCVVKLLLDINFPQMDNEAEIEEEDAEDIESAEGEPEEEGIQTSDEELENIEAQQDEE